MNYILAIESSCDDTAAAILYNNKVLSNIVATQEIHARYGGVVPELASRSHQANIVPAVEVALKQANITKKALQAIAFTRGPGLLGSLMVGSSFAKALSLALDIPLLAVNHMEAHIMAHFIEDSHIVPGQGAPAFPFLCLTVSGGHTQLVKVNAPLSFELLGETLDDAAGEAFDKAAKLLGLPYPGGPEIDRLARQGNPDRFSFAAPQMKNHDFSFSGLKTSLLYFLRDQPEGFVQDNLADLAASFQKTVVETLLQKLVLAAKQTDIREIALAGGVSANSYLRERLMLEGAARGWQVYIPKLEYCTDNAAMIGITGYYKYLAGDFADQSVGAEARMGF